MTKRVDLTGNKYERWVVESFAYTRKKHIYWNCLCDCGIRKVVSGDTLRGKYSRSCGCLQKERASEASKSRKHTEETIQKMRDNHADVSNEKNPRWKGDKVGYHALHSWIRKNKPTDNLCEICHLEKPLDVSNISGEYKRDINDFQWLCVKCHMKSDGRTKNKLNWRIKCQN